METTHKSPKDTTAPARRVPTAAVRITSVRPGPDIELRTTADSGYSAVARRDLGRYYALLETGRRELVGRFSQDALEQMGRVLVANPILDLPEALAVAPHILIEAAERGDISVPADGIRALSSAEIWALVDAAELVANGRLRWDELGA